MYADVIVNISVEELDRPYTYRIPDRLLGTIRPGVQVAVPFGNRQIKGFVIALKEKALLEESRIKDIAHVVQSGNAIEEKLIELAAYMKEQFGSTMNEALKCCLPVSRKVKEIVSRTITSGCTTVELTSMLAQAQKKHYAAQERFFENLIEKGEIDYSYATKVLKVPTSFLNRLVADSTITISSNVVYRNPFKGLERDERRHELSTEQTAIIESFAKDIKEDIRSDYLIHGVTGSGKTEVYMQMIEHVIAAGKQVIMLIPEIALTYQTVSRFYKRFGDRIAVINSKLSQGERYDQYMRAKRGETDIMIGPRSALFTPFERLGLIIIDEEHEGSYRSETAPTYHAREVALKRGVLEGASVVLGSATPSLESYTMALAGRLKLFTLKNRVGGGTFPQVTVADMREELKNRNRSMFSRELMEKIKDRLEKREQIMLFLNRRGVSGFVSCRECGTVLKCPHCDVSLTLHNDNTLRCHYCGYAVMKPETCPSCSSKYIGAFGVGTERVEDNIRKLFPGARVLRMDADTTRRKGSYEEILESFSRGEADILIGTQMIVKGHDFHKVTLVGILLADMSLYSSDFRSGEKTYQLLAQAAGRAGRGELRGEVIIQTYNPENYAITAAASMDYESFYREEMSYRQAMGYPPAGVLLSIRLSSSDEASLEKAAAGIKERLTLIAAGLQGDYKIRVIGPAKAPVYKLSDVFRMETYVKSFDYGVMISIKDRITDMEKEIITDDVRVEYNFNY